MEIPLSEKKTAEGTVEYRIHPLFRFVFAAISLFVSSASTLYGSVSLPGLLVAIIALLGALYTELWIFRPDGNTVTYATGVFPFLAKKEWNRDEIECLSVSAFMKGELDQTKTGALLEKMDTGIVRPSLIPFNPGSRVRIRFMIELKDGTTLAVDDSGIRSRQRLIALARRVSELCGIPYRD